MPLITSRPATDKIIFLSFEGSVTEEEYFLIVMDIFSEVKSRVQFISVAEDEVHTRHNCRTPEQVKVLSKTRPKQFTAENIKVAIERAEQLHINKMDKQPKYLATTVYIILEKIIDLLPN